MKWRKLKQLLYDCGFRWHGKYEENWNNIAVYKKDANEVHIKFLDMKPWGDIEKPRKFKVEIVGIVDRAVAEFLLEEAKPRRCPVCGRPMRDAPIFFLLGEKMKIHIQGYWDAKINSAPKGETAIPAEELLKQGRKLIVCEIIIDDIFCGSVMWDGNKLEIEHPAPKILSKSEFKEQLKQLLGEESHEWTEMTNEDFECLYADYFKSGKTFDEWKDSYIHDVAYSSSPP